MINWHKRCTKGGLMPAKTKRTMLMAAVAAKNKKARDAFLDERGAGGCDGGKGKRFLDLKTGRTVKEFRKSVKPVIQAEDGDSLDKLKGKYVIEDQKAVVAFDAHYRKYIFDILMQKHGFKRVEETVQGNTVVSIRRDGLDIECVYHDILLKLMLGVIQNFDMSGKNVGNGAFRNYLKMVIGAVVGDAFRGDLVPVLKPDGSPEYTDRVLKDRHGKAKRDANGNVMYKPKMKLRWVFENDNMWSAVSKSSLNSAFSFKRGGDWTQTDIHRIRLCFAKYAYIEMTEEKKKSPSASWILGAMADILERGQDERVVRENLIKDKVIRSENVFYTAKCRYLSDWRDRVAGYENDVFKVSVSREGRCLWHPKMSYADALKKVENVAAEIYRLVGRERISFINQRFSAMMIRVVIAADEKVAQRNAKRFSEIEPVVKAELKKKKEEKERKSREKKSVKK